MRFFRCLLGFLLGLIATAALLYLLRPEDEMIEATVENAAHCNVLIVGPSYIKVGLDPDDFDAEAKSLGSSLRVCKFARTALRGYELKHDLKRLLAHRWPKLRYVAVDITLRPGNLGFDRENWWSPRVVNWHDWEALGWAYRYYREIETPWRELAPLALAHLEHFAMNYLGVGRVGRVLTQGRFTERLTGAEQRREVQEDVNRVTRKSKLVTPSVEQHDAAVRKLVDFKARPRRRKGPEDDAWPRELESVIRARKLKPVFIYSPVYSQLLPPRAKRPKKPALVFLDFDDPAHYPTLYDYDVRGHSAHLNGKGAVIYSRLLAREFVELDSK